MTRRGRLRALALALCLCAVLSGCMAQDQLPQSSPEASPEASPAASPAPSPTASVPPSATAQATPEALPEEAQQAKELMEQNEDCIGYVYVPDTNIASPVMHVPGDNEYYLYLGFDEKYAVEGSIFLDGACSTEPRSVNWLLHGHNMKNGSMFADLLSYKDEVFYKKHPLIYFATDQGVERYEIFACFTARVLKTTETGFRYYRFLDPATKEEFDEGIAEMLEMSLYPLNIVPEYGEKLLTLSTCEYSTENGRMVVCARLLE